MNDLAEVIRELRRITQASTSCGWMCDECTRFLYAVVQFHRPDLVIQTGHLWGKTAAAILAAMEVPEPLDDLPQTGDPKFRAFIDERSPTNVGELISIDPLPLDVMHFMAGVDYLNKRYGGRLRFVRAKSKDFLADFRTDAVKILGVVDGDHSDEGCRADLEALAKLGAKTIVADDVVWIPSLEKVVREFAQKHGYDCTIHRVYSGLAVLTK